MEPGSVEETAATQGKPVAGEEPPTHKEYIYIRYKDTQSNHPQDDPDTSPQTARKDMADREQASDILPYIKGQSTRAVDCQVSEGATQIRHSEDAIAQSSTKHRKALAKKPKRQRQQGPSGEPDLSVGDNHFYMVNSTVQLGDTQKPTKSDLENMIDATKLMMENKDPAKHVSTRAERSALRLLKTFSAVFIKGRSGSGKSSVGLRLLTEISNAKDSTTKPVYLTFAHQWIHIPTKRELSLKYVVLIDDIFGSSNLVQSQVDEWTRLFDVMWPSVESGQIRLVITSRPEISAQCENKVKKFKLMKNIHSVTLDEGEFELNAPEKEKLLKKICGKKLDLTQEQINSIVCSNSSISLGFPQCCEFFASNTYAQAQGAKFFHESVEYVAETISRLKETDQLGYAVLLLVMLNQGRLVHEQVIRAKPLADFQFLVSEVSEALGLSKPLSLIQMKTKVDSFRGIYLKKSGKDYIFQHRSLFDALFNEMAKEYSEILIRICPVQMLLERVKTQDENRGLYEFLCLTPDCYDQLAKRITEILLSGQDGRILGHPSLQDKRFLQYVTARWKEFSPEASIRPERVVMASTMISYSDGRYARTEYCLLHCDNLLASIVLNCRTLGGYLLKKILRKSKIADVSSQVLACATYTGQSDLVQMLLDKGVTTDESCFRALCGSRDLDEAVSDRLLQKLDMNWDVLQDKERMLCLASVRGNSLITKKLFNQISTDRETTALDCLKVMYSDTRLREDTPDQKMQTMMSILLDYIQNPDIDTKSQGCFSLIVMCAGHALSLKELFSREWKFTSVQWWHSLNEALKYGSIECVQELIAHHPTEPCRNDNVTKYICAAAESRRDVSEKIKLVLNHFSTNMQALSESSDKDASAWIKTLLNKLNADCNPPIHSAVKRQNTEALELLTNAGADVNMLDNRGRTPLHIAADLNATQTIQFLTQHGANVNMQNEKGETPLHHAVGKHYMECVKLLLEAGADVSIRNYNTHTVLLLAEKLGIIKSLVSSGSDVNITDKRGETALHKAIQRNDMDAVKFLVTKGANVNSTYSDGLSALHMAATFADVDILKYLCEKGAIVTATTHNNGKAVVHCAVQSKTDTMEKLQYLFDIQNIAVDVTDNFGWTALYYVIQSWDQEVAEFLIKKGCGFHPKKEQNRTLLFHAVYKKNKPAFDFLVRQGLDVKHVDRRGRTLLHAICSGWTLNCNFFKWVSLLLDAGVDPDQCADYNSTALHMAVKSYGCDDSLRVCQLLIEKMTNVDQPDRANSGQTALHLAVRHGCDKIVHLLLQKGADTNIKDDKGKTAEDYAGQRKVKLFQSNN